MKKKVLFAIPTLDGGGAERVLVTLLNNLDSDKYEITLFSIFDGGINKEYLNNNIKYRYYFKKIFKGNIHLFKIFSPKYLYKKMIKDDYDIVISYLEGPMTRIIGGCPYSKIKMLNWVHTEINDTNAISRSYRNFNEVIGIYDRFNATVFVSNTAKNAFKKTIPQIEKKSIVKYNTVDTKLIISRSKEELDDIDINNDKINLISVGRFTKQKGYKRLLKIMKKLILEGFNVHLYLLGKGELENQYRKIIRKYKLSNSVTILGYKDNPYKFVKACDLFICSSYEEGYSTAVSESIIVGTPVVTTLCSGMIEMLGENNEYGIITKNNEESLYKGIKKVITTPENLEYYKRKVIERRSIFSTEATVKSVENLLDKI